MIKFSVRSRSCTWIYGNLVKFKFACTNWIAEGLNVENLPEQIFPHIVLIYVGIYKKRKIPGMIYLTTFDYLPINTVSNPQPL